MMKVVMQSFLIFILVVLMTMFVHAEDESNQQRGELLYSTSCGGCHASSIHWRELNLVTDWKSLKVQVTRWQAYSKLNWKEEDINDVALYLNANFYHFLNPESKKLSGNEYLE
jgi:mono/diheme cytochrome c family protein